MEPGPRTGSSVAVVQPSCIRRRRVWICCRAFSEVADLMRQAPAGRMLGNPPVLLAALYLRWDRPEDALSALVPSLAECEREDTGGFILLEGASAVPVLQLAVRHGLLPRSDAER
jgi:hypothetical protein